MTVESIAEAATVVPFDGPQDAGSQAAAVIERPISVGGRRRSL
jgi:hypothetical protein